ncbi:hypothetical protein LQZ19_08690 [Treponema primitia]|uniref:hypothetical protein n=1 Tax=Treponema primitia TaxID=88058 RepID=UPI00397FFBA4
MKIEAIGHSIVTRNPETRTNTTHLPGKPFEIDEKQGGILINRGVAKRADTPQIDKPAEVKK